MKPTSKFKKVKFLDSNIVIKIKENRFPRNTTQKNKIQNIFSASLEAKT